MWYVQLIALEISVLQAGMIHGLQVSLVDLKH